jgi:hypothetical protein
MPSVVIPGLASPGLTLILSLRSPSGVPFPSPALSHPAVASTRGNTGYLTKAAYVAPLVYETHRSVEDAPMSTQTATTPATDDDTWTSPPELAHLAVSIAHCQYLSPPSQLASWQPAIAHHRSDLDSLRIVLGVVCLPSVLRVRRGVAAGEAVPAVGAVSASKRRLRVAIQVQGLSTG